MTGDPRQGAAYYRLAEQARQESHCFLCGRPIDHTLPRDAAGAPSADHLTPIGLGGHILGPMRGAHRVCNMRRKQRPLTPELMYELAARPLEYDATDVRGRAQRTPRHSQDW